MKNFNFNTTRSSEMAASVELLKAGTRKPRTSTAKRTTSPQRRNPLGWMADGWLYLHREHEHGWFHAGRTWLLNHQRYLREVKKLRHVRLSNKLVKGVQPWFEVQFKDGTSKFVNGFCSRESFVRNFCSGNPTGYLDTYEDPNIVRIAKKAAKSNKFSA